MSTIQEKPMPESILHNKIFKKLLESVKLINFIEDIFNLEVKNMTDLQAQHEIGYSEGHEQGFADGIEKGFNEGKEKGSLEQARKIAKSLYEQGVPIEIISHSSGLSKEEILQL